MHRRTRNWGLVRVPFSAHFCVYVALHLCAACLECAMKRRTAQHPINTTQNAHDSPPSHKHRTPVPCCFGAAQKIEHGVHRPHQPILAHQTAHSTPKTTHSAPPPNLHSPHSTLRTVVACVAHTICHYTPPYSVPQSADQTAANQRARAPRQKSDTHPPHSTASQLAVPALHRRLPTKPRDGQAQGALAGGSKLHDHGFAPVLGAVQFCGRGVCASQ